MSGTGGGGNIIAAWVVAKELGPKPPHDGSRQAQLDREELQEHEHELYADPGSAVETGRQPEPAPAEHHLHLPHRPGHGT
jgi:hypothetical protein